MTCVRLDDVFPAAASAFLLATNCVPRIQPAFTEGFGCDQRQLLIQSTNHINGGVWLNVRLQVSNLRGVPLLGNVFLNPAGCCRQPYSILTVQVASVFLLARASHVPCQLADRAFSAQRFSGGRAGRRFTPPSADLGLQGWI